MQITEILIGIAEIATALTGFTGIVMTYGSQKLHMWESRDRLHLTFLLEASLSAAGYALTALLLLATIKDEALSWEVMSGIWSLLTCFSLLRAHQRLKKDNDTRKQDKALNTMLKSLFAVAMVMQVCNIIYWHEFAPILGAMLLNLASAAIQFGRLIQSAFNQQYQARPDLQTIYRFKPDHLQVTPAVARHNFTMQSVSNYC
jgi:hypothetical protein